MSTLVTMAQRTTLTLQDDVYAAARALAERTGRPLRDVGNDALRAGLDARPAATPVRLREFSTRPRIDVVNTGRELEVADGPTAR